MLKDFSKENFDIFIQAGQSNSEGYGVGDVEEPYVKNDQVWYMNEDFTLSCAVENVVGNEIQSNFALSFAREYIKSGLLKDGRKLLILRAAEGGTGFLDCRWRTTDDLYLRMIDMAHTALALNERNRILGLLWHQGETDAQLEASYEVHYNHLLGMVQSVRKSLNLPNLPFICGDFVYHWRNENIGVCRPVIDAIRAVSKDCGHGYFVETEGLLSNWQELQRYTYGGADSIHFSRKSIYDLGERYFKAYMEDLKSECRL